MGRTSPPGNGHTGGLEERRSNATAGDPCIGHAIRHGIHHSGHRHDSTGFNDPAVHYHLGKHLYEVGSPVTGKQREKSLRSDEGLHALSRLTIVSTPQKEFLKVCIYTKRGSVGLPEVFAPPEREESKAGRPGASSFTGGKKPGNTQRPRTRVAASLVTAPPAPGGRRRSS